MSRLALDISSGAGALLTLQRTLKRKRAAVQILLPTSPHPTDSCNLVINHVLLMLSPSEAMKLARVCKLLNHYYFIWIRAKREQLALGFQLLLSGDSRKQTRGAVTLQHLVASCPSVRLGFLARGRLALLVASLSSHKHESQMSVLVLMRQLMDYSTQGCISSHIIMSNVGALRAVVALMARHVCELGRLSSPQTYSSVVVLFAGLMTLGALVTTHLIVGSSHESLTAERYHLIDRSYLSGALVGWDRPCPSAPWKFHIYNGKVTEVNKQIFRELGGLTMLADILIADLECFCGPSINILASLFDDGSWRRHGEDEFYGKDNRRELLERNSRESREYYRTFERKEQFINALVSFAVLSPTELRNQHVDRETLEMVLHCLAEESPATLISMRACIESLDKEPMLRMPLSEEERQMESAKLRASNATGRDSPILESDDVTESTQLSTRVTL